MPAASLKEYESGAKSLKASSGLVSCMLIFKHYLINKMKDLDQIYFINQGNFHSWLEKNFDKSPGIWMIFYKTHTNVDCINYHEALEEALCYGWIDSIIKKLDNDRYVRKFTPRTNTNKWSELNKKIVDALIKEGRMTEEGLKKIDIYLKTGSVEWENKEFTEKSKKEFSIPVFILNELSKNEPALRNFNHLPPTYKRHYVLWISSAKKGDTILKRLRESIELLKENKQLGLK
jgi:uncharacterized protein YdeI (YjbR/CyaY-like superfamily)